LKFVRFAPELLGREDFVEPYRNIIFETIGKKLRTYNSKDIGHSGDKERDNR